MNRILVLAVTLAAFTSTVLADSLRSDRHFVKIDVQSLSGTTRQYNVQVFDAASRNHVTHMKVVTKGDAPEEAETTASGTRYKVRIEPHGTAYLIAFTADDGTEAIDAIRGGFTQTAASNPAQAHPVRGGRDISQPALLRRIEPVYTEQARAAGAAGTVVLELLIDRSGFVRDATVIKTMGYGLEESAVEAAKQWQFAPSMQQQVPVEVVLEVTIEFKP